MGLLRFGDFTLDRGRRTLTKRGDVVQVQPKALTCIELFACHPGVLFSPARLQEALWPNVHVGNDAVRRLIREVRRTLGDRGDSQDFVITRKGIGYEFRSDVQAIDNTPLRKKSAVHGWPFVGRERELATLSDALEPVISAPARFCLVQGEAGAGKSALVEELRRRAQENSVVFLLGHCPQGCDIPGFWPFRQIARQLVQRPRSREIIAAWLDASPGLGSMLPELRSEGSCRNDAPLDEGRRFELYRQFVKLVVHLSTLVPLLVVIEDVQFADDGSLLILEQLTLVERSRSLGLLATCRPTELGADPVLHHAACCRSRDI